MLFSSFFITTVILAFSPGYSSPCSENEIDADCVNPCNTCEQRGDCDPPPTCRSGCDCRPGFFRDHNGFCVPEHRCRGKPESPRCPKNAIFLSCAPLALPSCDNPYLEPDDDDECVPGCVCRPGFLKRKDGRCVTPDRCLSKEDRRREIPGECQEDEEYYDCPPSCQNTCENIHNPGAKCRCGPPGCFCREGLLKRSDGKCVHPKHCPRSPSPNDPPPKCPKNAIFIKCGSPCPPTCDDLQPEPCEEKCTTACYCKPGYLKRNDGVCVRPMHCNPRKKQERPPPKCPENAIFIECGSPCPPTCEDRLPVCEENCTKACYCKPGFLLKTAEAKCVKPEHCGTSNISADAKRCPANEEPSDCVIPCNNCKTKGNCKFFACNKGCECKKGYFRNMDGKCILASECPETWDPQPKCATDEQFYECTPRCKNTCVNISNPAAKCQCGPPSCFCREGLIKREDGKCVLPEQCEATKPVCQENAEFSACGPSCKPTCKDPYPSNSSGPCLKGCFCRSGFVEDSEGRCVRLKNCSKKCLRPGEEFQECGSTCPDTCENKGRPAAGTCPYRCNRGCHCKKGLYRTKSGHCVPLKDCDGENYSTTTSKPTVTRENTDAFAVTVPDDCHGCPNRVECEAYCRTLGDYIGLCTGKYSLHCRCA